MKTRLSHLYFRAVGAFPYELEKAVHPYAQVLDVGCGTQSPLHYFSDRLEATGVDGYAPALEKSRERGIHKNYLNLDLRKIGENIPKNSYDCVVCASFSTASPRAAKCSSLPFSSSVASTVACILSATSTTVLYATRRRFSTCSNPS